MLTIVPYDKTNPISIETYAKRLISHTFLEVLESRSDGNPSSSHEAALAFGNSSRKGGLGNLLEEYYFGYKANSNQEADFKEAGVELKATPYEKNKNGTLRAGERVVITMISYNQPVEFDFFKSHVWNKIKLILFVYYWRNKQLDNNLLYPIDYVKLFSPPANDLLIVQNDYQLIIAKITAGKAHEISESDTMYLGACTKGATAEKSTLPQFYSPNIPARKRAFCYKQSYMTYVLNKYIVKDHTTYEPIIKDISVLTGKSFSDYITGLINSHIDQSDKFICNLYNREYNNNKAQWIDLSYRMLGIKSNHAEEFIKANIVVKAIRLEEDGRMIESMSFPPFKFKNIVNQEWEDSDVFTYFDETKFLFVIFQKKGDYFYLKGSQIWNMPYEDLHGKVYEGWLSVKETIIEGVKFTINPNGTVSNNLLSKHDNEIIHIRPHAAKSAYRLKNGFVKGNVEKDANELPDGQWMTTQSFWINNSYILNQLNNA